MHEGEQRKKVGKRHVRCYFDSIKDLETVVAGILALLAALM